MKEVCMDPRGDIHVGVLALIRILLITLAWELELGTVRLQILHHDSHLRDCPVGWGARPGYLVATLQPRCRFLPNY